MYPNRKLIVSLILILSFIASVTALARQSVGLVLSGGGAKGIAHIGVIKALEDHEIAVDYVTGTSMGAIIGGLYAAGYTPEEMLALIQSPDFVNWSSGKIDKKLYYYFAQTEDTPSFTTLALGARDSSVTQLLPASLISPLPMNYAFMDLFSAYTAQCSANFDNLFVPFRCVCSDIYHKHKVVLSKGSFGDAIRASMSFPTVFRPIEIDSLLMYDGGIYDNFPVDVMHDVFKPDIMIGVNVSGPDGKPIPDDLFQQLEDMIIQNNDYSMPDQWGVKIDVPVRGFGLLAWDQAQQIYDIGYKTAEAMIDSISSRVTARTPMSELAERRRRFRAATPEVRFDSIEVSGGTKSQNDYIAYLFSPHKGDTIGLEQVKDAYYRALTPGRLENLVPQAIYRPGESLFTLRLKSTPKQNFEVGVGGYLTSSTTSMLFLSAGYRTMSFNSTSTDLSGWIGQSYLAGALNSRLNLHTYIPSRLHLQIVASRHKYYENDKLFFEGTEPVFITKSEVFGRFLYEWAMGRHGLGEAGAGWGHLTSKYYRTDSDFPVERRDEMTRNLGQLMVRYRYNTLDSKMYPTTGASYNITGMGVLGTYRYFPASSAESRTRDHRRWLQFESVTRNYFGLGKQLSLGVETDILLSTRQLLNSYYSSIVEAPGFNPTPASNNTFNTALRANSFLSAGIVPVWHPGSMFQLRGSFHGFLPLRPILRGEQGVARYGKWFSHGEFFGEVAGVITFPFASLSVYGNYTTAPTGTWNVGVSFGIYLLAPRFLR